MRVRKSSILIGLSVLGCFVFYKINSVDYEGMGIKPMLYKSEVDLFCILKIWPSSSGSNLKLRMFAIFHSYMFHWHLFNFRDIRQNIDPWFQWYELNGNFSKEPEAEELGNSVNARITKLEDEMDQNLSMMGQIKDKLDLLMELQNIEPSSDNKKPAIEAPKAPIQVADWQKIIRIKTCSKTKNLKFCQSLIGIQNGECPAVVPYGRSGQGCWFYDLIFF